MPPRYPACWRRIRLIYVTIPPAAVRPLSPIRGRCYNQKLMRTPPVAEHMILTTPPTMADLEQVELRLGQDPANVDNLDWLAFMFYTLHVFDRALRHYSHLVTLVPTNSSYRF